MGNDKVFVTAVVARKICDILRSYSGEYLTKNMDPTAISNELLLLCSFRRGRLRKRRQLILSRIN